MCNFDNIYNVNKKVTVQGPESAITSEIDKM